MAKNMLLLDENLSYRLIGYLKPVFPNMEHIGSLDLTASPDGEIWKAASEGQFTIVTNDSDFQHLSSVKGCPPKVIHLRCRNKRTKELADILASRAEEINRFVKSDSCYMEIVGI